MADEPPERISVSIPSDAELDAETIDELVAKSECESRSEFIRKCIADSGELADY